MDAPCVESHWRPFLFLPGVLFLERKATRLRVRRSGVACSGRTIFATLVWGPPKRRTQQEPSRSHHTQGLSCLNRWCGVLVEFRCCCSFFSVGSLGSNPDLNQDLPTRISQVCSPLDSPTSLAWVVTEIPSRQGQLVHRHAQVLWASFRVSACLRQQKTLTGHHGPQEPGCVWIGRLSSNSLRIASNLLKIVPQWAGPRGCVSESGRPGLGATNPPRNFPETPPKPPETSPKLPRNPPKLPRNLPETSPKPPKLPRNFPETSLNPTRLTPKIWVQEPTQATSRASQEDILPLKNVPGQRTHFWHVSAPAGVSIPQTTGFFSKRMQAFPAPTSVDRRKWGFVGSCKVLGPVCADFCKSASLRHSCSKEGSWSMAAAVSTSTRKMIMLASSPLSTRLRLSWACEKNLCQ